MRPLRLPGGIGTSRPSSEDRSSTLVRRPGLSSLVGPRAAGGITVAGQRRILTGFAELSVIPARVRDSQMVLVGAGPGADGGVVSCRGGETG